MERKDAKIGSTVILGRHPRGEDWHSSMDQYVGKKAKIVSTTIGNNDKMIARVDVDGGSHYWRTWNMTLVSGPVADTKATETKAEKGNTAMSVMEILKDRGKKAGIRGTGRQITRGTRAAIISLLKSKGADEGTLAIVAAFLETEFGTGVVSLILGGVLPQIPMLNQDTRVQVLAEEFQVEGLTVVGDAVLGEVMKYFTPVVVDALRGMERIEEETDAAEEVETTATAAAATRVA